MINITAFKNKNLSILALSFGLLFFGFNAAEQHFTAFYQTIGQSQIAFNSLAILYAAIIFGNFVAPSLVNKIGIKSSFIIGFLTYTLLVFVIVFKQAFLIYFFSFLLGTGAGLSGIANAQFLHIIAPRQKRGEFASAIETLRIFGGFTGIASLSFILKFIPIEQAFIFLGAIMLLGVVLLGLLFKSVEEKRNVKKEIAKPQSLKEMASFFRDRRVYLLLPRFVAGGFLLGLVLGSVPTVIEKNYSLGWVGLITSLFHLTIASSVLIAGYFSDIKGKFKFIYASLIITILGSIIFLNFQSLIALSLTMILLGIGDSLGKGAFTAVILDTFEEKIKEVSAVLGNLSIVLGIVPSFLLPQWLNDKQLFSLAIGLVAFSIITLRIFESKYQAKPHIASAAPLG